jgi:hypothetical protein
MSMVDDGGCAYVERLKAASKLTPEQVIGTVKG